jgi:flagellar biosynthesis protein FliR
MCLLILVAPSVPSPTMLAFFISTRLPTIHPFGPALCHSNHWLFKWATDRFLSLLRMCVLSLSDPPLSESVVWMKRCFPFRLLLFLYYPLVQALNGPVQMSYYLVYRTLQIQRGLGLGSSSSIYLSSIATFGLLLKLVIIYSPSSSRVILAQTSSSSVCTT